jgi:hypothetical protein
MRRSDREATPASSAGVTLAVGDGSACATAVAAYLLRERQIRGRSTAERASDLGWS